MSDIREIKSRMKSVSDTAKITKAMYMISSSKMRKARAELERTRPHFDALNSEIKRIFRSKSHIDSPYMYPADGSHDLPGAYAYIVVTSDKGLAGFYNHAVIKEFESQMTDHESRYFMVGDYGCKYCDALGIEYDGEFRFSADNPTMRRTRRMADYILDEYDAGRISKIFLIYTDLENNISQKARTVRLLPFHRKDFTDEATMNDNVSFNFYPSAEGVLDSIVRSYVAEYLYSALVDSYCCEQSARMNAMDEADQNANELMAELRLEYNHARQGKITREITEISAGARALKKKKTAETVAKGAYTNGR
ncbi:MAG: ATP synthase F1 subunit gamma [Lachnospiraceae bacterium]|nr:ATP synthase F1 subunit gamma [Lachnospiraceae bacterium]